MLIEHARYDADGKKFYSCIHVWQIDGDGKIKRAKVFANKDMASILNSQMFKRESEGA